MHVEAELTREQDGGFATRNVRMTHPSMVLYHPSDIDEQIQLASTTITQRMDNFTQTEGSGWVISEIIRLTLSIAAYDSVLGSSYIPTPQSLSKKRAVINIKNKDDRCFLYCILAQLYPADRDRERPNKYDGYFSQINYEGLIMPMAVDKITKFENLNPSISVSVLYIDPDERTIFPVRVTSHRGRKHHVNLLLLQDEYTGLFHYTLITGLSRLLHSQTKNGGCSYPCPYCLHRCKNQTVLDEHSIHCGKHKPLKIKFPHPLKKSITDGGVDGPIDSIHYIEEIAGEDAAEVQALADQLGVDLGGDEEEELPPNILKFKNVMNQYPVPFAIYLDFESFLVKNGDRDDHIPSGFCCLTVSAFPEHYVFEPVLFSGEDVMGNFFTHLKSEGKKIENILSVEKPMRRLTKEELVRKETVTHCGCCEKRFSHNRPLVRHHEHVTGEFIDFVCRQCNLQLKTRRIWGKGGGSNSIGYREKKFLIPVICHNMKSYDSHLILNSLGTSFQDSEISAVAQNTEKFICFTIDCFKFMDSMQFLNCSLDSLVCNLAKGDASSFVSTRRHYNDDEDKINLVTCKGVYPYEYMDGPHRFDETVLPPSEAFFSKLYGEGISEEEYARAQNVWDKFGIKTMRDYHDLYLKTDVLLLADVFEAFRKVSISNYGLDPLHYLTAPGLSWDAMLKKTKVELELLTNHDQLLFLERGVRGGVSSIINRHSEANNSHLPDSYDPTMDSKYIIYLDANSLYGWAMSQPLPLRGFRFLTEREVEDFPRRLMKLTENDKLGYILEVDLEYPDHLHDLHNDYPLCPEHMSVSSEMLSPCAKDLLKKLNKKVPEKGEGEKKLIPSLLKRENYVVHYLNLQYYVNKGMRIRAVHRIFQFEQSRWLEPYINFNTEKRKLAANPFEKDFYKLLVNSVFGKTMQNKRQYQDVRLVTDPKAAKKLISRPTFSQFRIVNENLTIVKLQKVQVYWDSPTYAGMCILDLSKLHMYRFHYDHMVKNYGFNAKLLFTDTDSLTYELKTEDVYKDMLKHVSLFDTSDYPKTHILYNAVNAKVLGKFKDECNGKPPLEFVGLRSKMYSILLPGDASKNAAKGIKKAYVKKNLRHANFRDCLFLEETTRASFYSILSKKQKLQTVPQDKVALCPYDDKRYLMPNGYDTLAYGHWRIRPDVTPERHAELEEKSKKMGFSRSYTVD